MIYLIPTARLSSSKEIAPTVITKTVSSSISHLWQMQANLQTMMSFLSQLILYHSPFLTVDLMSGLMEIEEHYTILSITMASQEDRVSIGIGTLETWLSKIRQPRSTLLLSRQIKKKFLTLDFLLVQDKCIT